MSKTRQLFTLSIETSDILKEQKNKSDYVDKAVNFYHYNKDKTDEKTQTKLLENVGITI